MLRHTAASAWLSSGLGLPKVAALLGDTKEVVLATYTHFMPDDDDRAREMMNAFFEESPRGLMCSGCAKGDAMRTRFSWPGLYSASPG